MEYDYVELAVDKEKYAKENIFGCSATAATLLTGDGSLEYYITV